MSVKIVNRFPLFLSKLELKVKDNLKIVGERVKQDAKTVVRVDTGRLKRSIISVVSKTPRRIRVDIGSKKTANGKTTGPNDDNAFYAFKQEEGIDPRATTPYLLPSIHKAIPLIKRLFR